MKQWNNVSIKIKDGQGNWVPIPGIAGESAYEIAVRRGTFSGTEQEWMNATETERAAAVASIQSAAASAIASIPSDYTELSEEINETNDALGTVVKTVQNESYSSALPVSRTNLTIGTGSTAIAIPNDTSLVKTFQAGKKYFAYAELTFSNISGYSAGNAYLQYLYTASQSVVSEKMAGKTDQPIANGKIILYGFFTAVAGQSRPAISFRNTSAQYTLDITLDKLFLAETDVDYSNVLSSWDNGKYINVADFPDESVGYDNLSQTLRASFPSNNKTIIDCWGDSLTQGAGSTNYPYPIKLQDLIGESATVNNYGQGGESAEDIAFRQGGMNAVIDPFEFSTGAITAPITGRFINGQIFGNLNTSGQYLGNNNVLIDNNPFMFRRGSSGFYVGLLGTTSSTHSYDRPQLCVAEGKGVGHICLICIGQNGWVNSDPNTLADIIEGMIEHNNSDYYIVIGRPTGDTSSRATEESILATRFGDHFVNAREYISAYGLNDNNLTPTVDDETAMAAGAIPSTLKSDGTHLNDYGYIAMANCIYQRGKTLGYWA